MLRTYPKRQAQFQVKWNTVRNGYDMLSNYPIISPGNVNNALLTSDELEAFILLLGPPERGMKFYYRQRNKETGLYLPEIFVPYGRSEIKQIGDETASGNNRFTIIYVYGKPNRELQPTASIIAANQQYGESGFSGSESYEAGEASYSNRSCVKPEDYTDPIGHWQLIYEYTGE